jgi:hypothetical protein
MQDIVACFPFCISKEASALRIVKCKAPNRINLLSTLVKAYLLIEVSRKAMLYSKLD